jgi:tetratricopeptide (TPR) repeat protein
LAFSSPTIDSEHFAFWQSLLALAALKHEDESPVWVKDSDENQQKVEQWKSSQSDLAKIEEIADVLIKTVQPKVSANDLIDQLKAQGSNEEAMSQQFNEAIFKQESIELGAFSDVFEWCQLAYPTSTKVNNAVAFWLQRSKQWSLAIKAWRWCLTLKTVYPYMYYQLATCYQAEGNRELAFYFVDVAIDKNANNPNFWVLKASMLREVGDMVNALACFEKAAEIAPDKLGIIIPYCDLLEQEGDIEKAIAFNNVLLETHADNNVVQNMAIRLALKKDAKTGEAMYLARQLELLSALPEQRNLGLFAYLSKTGCQASERDLLSRVLSHWASIGLDVESKQNVL